MISAIRRVPAEVVETPVINRLSPDERVTVDRNAQLLLTKEALTVEEFPALQPTIGQASAALVPLKASVAKVEGPPNR